MVTELLITWEPGRPDLRLIKKYNVERCFVVPPIA
jgi:hypothetical protein